MLRFNSPTWYPYSIAPILHRSIRSNSLFTPILNGMDTDWFVRDHVKHRPESIHPRPFPAFATAGPTPNRLRPRLTGVRPIFFDKPGEAD